MSVEFMNETQLQQSVNDSKELNILRSDKIIELTADNIVDKTYSLTQNEINQLLINQQETTLSANSEGHITFNNKIPDNKIIGFTARQYSVLPIAGWMPNIVKVSIANDGLRNCRNSYINGVFEKNTEYMVIYEIVEASVPEEINWWVNFYWEYNEEAGAIATNSNFANKSTKLNAILTQKFRMPSYSRTIDYFALNGTSFEGKFPEYYIKAKVYGIYKTDFLTSIGFTATREGLEKLREIRIQSYISVNEQKYYLYDSEENQANQKLIIMGEEEVSDETLSYNHGVYNKTNHITGEIKNYDIKLFPVIPLQLGINKIFFSDKRIKNFTIMTIGTLKECIEHLSIDLNRSYFNIHPYFDRDIYEEQSMKLVNEVLHYPNGYDIIFVHTADLHYDLYEMGNTQAPLLLEAIRSLSHKIKLDFVLITGDMIHGKGRIGDEYCLSRLYQSLSGANCPILWTKGNHEGSDWSATGVPMERIVTSNALARMFHGYDVLSTGTKGYYYYDICSKLRVILLNSSEETYTLNGDKTAIIDYNNAGVSTYSNAQYKWLAEKALVGLSEGCQIVVGAHTNTDIIVQAILVARKNKSIYTNASKGISVDYSKEANVNIIGRFCGHWHNDKTIPGVINQFQSSCSASQFRYYPNEDDFDRSKVFFSVFCVDTKNRIIDRKYFGAQSPYEASITKRTSY